MLGVLSLVFWSLILVVTIKYVFIIMRADNRGEGGILALMAVVQRSLPIAAPLAYGVGILGIFGTALFFGDGVLTPAISVLSAVEGLRVVAPQLERFVVPVDARRAGAAVLDPAPWRREGRPPVRAGDGALVPGDRRRRGSRNWSQHPGVLQALSPAWAVALLRASTAWPPGWRWVRSCWRSPVARRSTPTWATSAGGPSASLGLWLVLPCLLLNYFGQGALHPRRPGGGLQPLLPGWCRPGARCR